MVNLDAAAEPANNGRPDPILELSDETLDKEIDLDAVHDAVAALLVRFCKVTPN